MILYIIEQEDYDDVSITHRILVFLPMAYFLTNGCNLPKYIQVIDELIPDL